MAAFENNDADQSVSNHYAMKKLVCLLFLCLICRSSAQDCGAILTNPSGTFSSPNFPVAYPENVTCVWNITVDPGQFISLTFTAFVLHSSDYVEVYDGSSSDAPVLLRQTNFYIPGPVLSTSNEMLITFVSDDLVAYSGFMAKYESITPSTRPPVPTPPPGEPDCGGTLYGDGRVVSPGYPGGYPDRSNCFWYIQSNSESSITLHFERFLTEVNDTISIYEGWEPTAGPLYQFSGEMADLAEVNSTKTNQFMIIFHSDESDNDSGFLLNFR